MRNFLTKSTIILLGFLLLFGGALSASAQIGGSSNFNPKDTSGSANNLLKSIIGNSVANESTWESVAWVSGYCGAGVVANIGANTVAGDFIGMDAIGSWIMRFACAPLLAYIFIYLPASFLLQLAVIIFNFCLSLSINALYVDQSFVTTIWTTMRDVSNLLFIFILLYAGITTMLGVAQTDWKKTVIRVIIVALLINFSLFFTKVVIDAGNTVGVGIYNSMGVAGQTVVVDGKETQGPRSIGGALVSTFALGNFVGQDQGGFVDSLIIFTLVGVINVAVAWVLFTVGLLFIGRLLAFWVLMIVAPLAFISSALPPQLNKFKDWFDTLVNQAFLAPVFLFMLYLILLASEPLLSLKNQAGGSGAGLANKAVVPVLGAVLIMAALIAAKKYTQRMSGKIGEISGELGGKIMGSAAGLTLGGVGFAGRMTAGKGADYLLKSGKFQKLASSDNAAARWVGRKGITLTDTARKGSFDVRESKVMGYTKAGFGAAGIKMADLGKTKGKGGYVQAEKEWEKKATERAKMLEVTNKEKEIKAKEINPQYEDAKNRREGQYLEKRAAQLKVTETEFLLGALKKPLVKAEQDLKKTIEEKEKIDKKLEEANERLALVTKTGDKARIQEAEKEIDQVSKEIVPAATNYVNARAALTKAKADYVLNNSSIEEPRLELLLKQTKAKAEQATLVLDATDKIIKETEDKIGSWAKVENERRREVSAKDSALEHFVVSKTSRQAIISKIRQGKTQKDSENELKKETLKIYLKEEAEKKQKEEGPKEEPEGGKKE